MLEKVVCCCVRRPIAGILRAARGVAYRLGFSNLAVGYGVDFELVGVPNPAHQSKSPVTPPRAAYDS